MDKNQHSRRTRLGSIDRGVGCFDYFLGLLGL
jgi:hypothetical protein